MRLRLIGLAVLLLLPSQLQARVVKWEGRAVTVLISTERLTRIEFPEPLRSAFLSCSDISIEKEDRSLYLRALLPDTQDTLFVVGESGTTYEINLSTSDKPDQTVLILGDIASFVLGVRRDIGDSAGEKSQEPLNYPACFCRDPL